MLEIVPRRPPGQRFAKRQTEPAKAQGSARPKLGKVTVDDADLFIGRFENGALANLEATRCAPGRKNQITIEINGTKGSLVF